VCLKSIPLVNNFGGMYWMTATMGVATSFKIFVFRTVIADKIYSFLIVIVNFKVRYISCFSFSFRSPLLVLKGLLLRVRYCFGNVRVSGRVI